MRIAALISCVLLPCLVSVSAPPARAAEAVEVEASAFFPVVEAGGFGEVSCVVHNRTSGELRVHVEGHVRYEGAGRSRILGPSVLEIPAGLSFEILPLFFVPEDADAGPAEFTCRAHVAGPLPVGERREIEPAGRRGEAKATFTVVE